MRKTHSYLLLKDHKPNFENNPQSRLINPSKTELGLISKSILKKITLKTQEKHYKNLWKDTSDTIKWLQYIKKKQQPSYNLTLQTSTRSFEKSYYLKV